MLSDARLVTITETTAEVAHEALIREWNRLHEWLSENREWLRLHRHITESAREWETQGQDPELVYRGTRLAQALEWAESHTEELNLLEREFLNTSKAIMEQESTEREQQQQRELEAVRKLAESERQRAEGQTRTARQLRQRALYLTGLVFLALFMAITAFVQRNTATKQTHLASARELALASNNNLSMDAELSILLAIEAVSESNSANLPVPYAVQDALHKAIQNSRIHYTLAEHSGDVIAVTYSADGKLLATASSDKKVILWEAATGKELMTLGGHSQAIEDIAFSPDGMYLATASDDKTVKLWNVLSGQELRSLTGHTDIIWKISFSADGKLLATGGNESAKIWDVNTGQSILNLEGQHAPVAFSPAGMYLATSGDDGMTHIWKTETWEEYLSLPYAANALAFSLDEKRLVTAITELIVWDVMTGEELVTTAEFTAVVMGIEFSPDGSQLAAGSQDGTVSVWDSQTGKHLFILAGHAGAVNDVAFSPECTAPPVAPFEWCGIWLASASRDGTAKVWDVSPGGSRELVTLPGFSGSFFDNTRMITNSFINPNEIEANQWDISTDGKTYWVAKSLISHAAPIIIGNISLDGTYIVTVDIDNTVKVWNAKAGREVATFVIDHTSLLAGIAVSPSGTQVSTIGNDGITKVWDTATGRELLKLAGYAGDIIGAAFSPDGKLIAISSFDGTVRVWEIATGLELITLIGHTQPVYVIAFSADGERIATAGMDQTARIWDVTSGNNLFTLAGHTASVLAVAFSPDGSLLVTGSHDGTARIWDISSGAHEGEELLTLTGHDGWIDYVSFAPDGKHIATGSFQDGTIRLYILDVMEVAALAQSRLTRALTLKECQMYLHLVACP
jgi:WD40 repeat protein